MRRYPQEIRDFIAENYVGITTAELVERVNAAFGSSCTIGQIKSYKANHRLRSGVKPGARESYYSKVFPKDVCEFIYANYAGVGYAQMASMLNERFGRAYIVSQIKNFYGNHHLKAGLSGRFQKGNLPFNKGRKGYHAPGCEKGWFKKGHMPQTHLPVGKETLRTDGYIWVKVSEPNKWRQKHVLIWEAAHGKRPAGHKIIFLDGDRGNLALENLQAVTSAEHAVMNHLRYRSESPDITRTGILMAKISIARRAAKTRKGAPKTGKQDKEDPHHA